MIEFLGDYWKVPADWRVFTANNIIRRDGRMVMGAGIAKDVRDRFPGVDLRFGQHLRLAPRTDVGDYLYAVDYTYQVVALQTKRDWHDPSPLDLVEASVTAFGAFARQFQPMTFVATRPGCGHGGLPWHLVKPICEQAWPDNVIVVSNLSTSERRNLRHGTQAHRS